MKKVMGIYLLIYAVLKGTCLVISLRSDHSHLPLVVMAACVLVMIGSVYVAVTAFVGRGRLRQLSQFFAAEILLTLMNITIMYFSPVEILPSDNWVTGNLFTILVDLVMMHFLLRQRRYIRTKYVSGEMDADSTAAPAVIWPMEETSSDEEMTYEGPEILGQQAQEENR